jgi:hypothetical protein
MPLGMAIALFSTLAHALMLVMLLGLPETRGRAIASLEPEALGPARILPRGPSGAVRGSRRAGGLRCACR